MKSRSILRVVSLAFLLVVGVGISAAVAAPATISATVKTAHSSKFGTLLVTSSGLTLYQLGTERKGTIKCTGACATAWPPLLISGGAKPKAGPGVGQATLGTIKRPDRGTQVTYNGKALYRFASDTKAGAVNGQDVAGFHVVVLSASATAPAPTTPAAGGATAPAPATPAAGGPTAPAPTTPAAGGGYGGGGGY
jgi:predicted lipoprotein with Yx(FWY)xxD motif